MSTESREAGGVDSMLRLSLGEGAVRAQVVSLTNAWREIVSRHALPSAVVRELGHLTAAGVLLAGALKFEGKLILQIHGDGPVRLVVVESDAQGRFRSIAKMTEEVEVDVHARLPELVNAGGNGRFVVTLDSGGGARRQTYQGIVQFEGDSAAMMLENYMVRSEQVPTRIWLAANDGAACGILLQRMPDDGGAGAAADPQAWERVCLLADTVTPDELLSATPEELVHRLFWQEVASRVDRKRCRFTCTCTREKVSAMLRLLGQDEVMGIVTERGSVEVHCDFCNQRYELDAVDCTQLFADAAGTAAAPSQARH